MKRTTKDTLEEIGSIDSHDNKDIKTFSMSGKNIKRLLEVKHQVLVMKNVYVKDRNKSNIKNEFIPILENLKRVFGIYDINIELVNYEQAFYGDIISKEQLLATPYDLFFSVEIDNIIASREKFIEFLVLKDRSSLTFLEDIIITNPVYLTDPWYSEEIQKLICWDTTPAMKQDIISKFKEILKDIKMVTASSKDLAEMFSSVSAVPVYCDQIADMKSNDNAFKVISLLQMANLFTKKQVYQDGVITPGMSRPLKVKRLIEHAAVKGKEYLNDDNTKNIENGDVGEYVVGEDVFNQLIPMTYIKFMVLALLDRDTDLRFSVMENAAELLEMLESEMVVFVEIMKDVLNAKISVPFE